MPPTVCPDQSSASTPLDDDSSAACFFGNKCSYHQRVHGQRLRKCYIRVNCCEAFDMHDGA